MNKEELKHFNNELKRYIKIHAQDENLECVYDVIKLIGENGCLNSVEKKIATLKAINVIRHFIEFNIMSYLTLEDKEFDNKVVDGFRHNIRNKDIYKDEKNIYFKAYYTCVQRIINVINDNIQNVCDMDEPIDRIYISHKGFLTGDYFEDCIIKQDKIDNKYFNIISKPIIPVDCFIDDKDNKIFVINLDNEKLHALSKYYYINYKHDEEVAKHRIDISKYGKNYTRSKSKQNTYKK